jgi:hypothetical protein
VEDDDAEVDELKCFTKRDKKLRFKYKGGPFCQVSSKN